MRKENNMVLLFDIDGVIRDWGGSAKRVLESVGYVVKPLDEWDWGLDTWFYDPLPIDEIHDLVFDKLAHQVYGDADTIPNARRVINDFYYQGHEVILVSNQFQSNIQDLTTEWLDVNSILHSGLIYTHNKQMIHGNLFVDDKPENIIRMAHSANVTMLFDQPWNRNASIQQRWRIYDWTEIDHLVRFLERSTLYCKGV